MKRLKLSFVGKGINLLYLPLSQSAMELKSHMNTPEYNSVAAVLEVVVQLVMWVVIIVSVLIVVLFGLGFMASINGGEFEIPGGAELARGVGPELFISALASTIVVMPGIVYVCMQLRRILKTLADGDPFVPENAPRLLKIATTIAIMELARYGVILLLMASLNFGEGESPRLSISLVAWVSAATMLVFSQVFREGSRLREEEKMTV